MLGFLDTVQRLARLVGGRAYLLGVLNANFFAHRQQSQYTNAKPCLQGMPVVSRGQSVGLLAWTL
jgi:hypothetical protein